MIGVTLQSPEKILLASNALDIKEDTIVFCGPSIYQNGEKVEKIFKWFDMNDF